MERDTNCYSCVEELHLISEAGVNEPTIKAASVPVMAVASNVCCITSSLNKMTRNCGRLEGRSVLSGRSVVSACVSG